MRDLVLGLGSPLMGDDGLGIVALERLRATRRMPAGLQLEDGGTWGLNLLPLIEEAGRVLVLDAVNAGQAPGSLVRLVDDAVPRYLMQKLSPHEVDFREVLALAELRGTLPGEVVVLGLQPESVTLSAELTPCVAARMQELVDAAAKQLLGWGHRCEPIAAPAEDSLTASDA